jgi:radical SAM protein with 4Fe4S-binding SPASM domain
MSKIQNDLGIQDKKSRHSLGSFTFLGANNERLPFDEKLLDRLAENVELSLEDKRIFEEIYVELEKRKKLPFQWTPQESNYLANNSREKWLDYIIYRYKFKTYPKKKVVAQFPIYLLIELTSMCNLRCKMCFQADRTFTTNNFKGSMPFELFRDIVDQAAEGGTKAITLGSRGEPLLYKDISKALHYLSNKFIELKLVTNATKLTEKICHDILLSNVNLLVFSIDACTEELYENIRVHGSFKDVYRNITRFEEIRAKEYSNSQITTRVSGVKINEEQDEAAFQRFWGEICDEVGMKKSFERWNTYENPVHADHISPCHFLWERMYIWFDGKVNPCDSDYKSELVVGNVQEKPIKKIWNEKKLNYLRELHLKGERHRLYPCDRCGI